MIPINNENEKNKSNGLQGYIAVLAIAGILLHVIFRFIGPSFLYPFVNYPLYVVLIFGGLPLVWDLAKKMLAFKFGSDLLAGISIVTSIILGEYLAGALVVLMLSGGLSIENYAIRTASKVLEALSKRAPKYAHKKLDGKLEDIPVDNIAIGDRVVIFPHEICPVDGDVVEGNGVMDEAYLTGEPFLISKAPGSEVISGAINGDASLTIQATKLAVDSRYAKIMQVMKESEQRKPHLRRLADQLGAWYTPIALIIGLFAWFLSGDSVRFLAVLVIATPCPLLIAIPVAIIGSISLCASRGILIKNPIVLEQLDQCKTMIFDKTGTLTYGKPVLTEQTVYNEENDIEILTFVSSLERYSKHPLSSAILEMAKLKNISLLNVTKVSEEKGKGLKGIVEGHNVIVTSRNKLNQFGLEEKITLLPKGEGLECVILIDGKLAAHYRFRDSPRKESFSFIKHLSIKHGINKTMIISGDREEEVKYLAKVVGIQEVYAGKSPEEKVELVISETKKNKTAYLGDGINDAPALAVATVGIAFGQNSDITSEASGVVILDSTLEKVDELLHISKRMLKIAKESAYFGMGLSIIGMFIAAFGLLPPVAGAIGQEVIDVLAILNSLRTIWRPSLLTDIQSAD